MKQSVIEKNEIFIGSPEYIDGVVNANDVHRLFDIAIEIHKTNESVEDVKEFLRKNLSEDFMHREKVLDYCNKNIEIIVSFLNYYNK